jgi:biopolymer transport protein ExbD
MPIKKNKEVEDLNLIPLMNLFVTMIPLLLLTAAFYHIGMVSASVPTQSDEETSVETGSTAVTVNVRMSPEGYNVTASSGTLTEAELKQLDAFIPKKDGKYDYATLTTVLDRIKRKYQESETMMLVPDQKAIYNEMIKTMDAARAMVVKHQGKKRRLPLFPVVVVTSVVE